MNHDFHLHRYLKHNLININEADVKENIFLSIYDITSKNKLELVELNALVLEL